MRSRSISSRITSGPEDQVVFQGFLNFLWTNRAPFSFTGQKSWRYDTGSWFISELCQVIQERAHDSDLMSMLTMVNNKLAKKIDRGSEGRITQIGEKTDNLRKKLYFNPQLTWAEYNT